MSCTRLLKPSSNYTNRQVEKSPSLPNATAVPQFSIMSNFRGGKKGHTGITAVSPPHVCYLSNPLRGLR